MNIRLTSTERAKLDDCICPLPKGSRRKRAISPKALAIPVVVFVAVVGIVSLVSYEVALLLLSLVGILMAASTIYRAVRGHTRACVVVWGPIAALYWIGDGIASATP